MIYISIKNEQNSETASDSKQYLLRVVYDSQDKNVHKLLEGIFGPDQMLDVKNGKIAKINSTLTPKERNCFFNMISEAIEKMECQDEDDSTNEDCPKRNKKEENENDTEELFKEEKQENNKEETLNEEIKEKIFQEEKDEKKEESESSRKVSAEKLIEEFASFLKNIS